MNIGDYVKTKSGYICKIININDFRELSMKYGVEVSSISDVVFMGDEDIIKSSPNIIDLIEVGDFIKYNQVQNHYAKKKTLYKAIKDERDLLFLKYQVQNDKLKILSIITHEQFSQMEYKL